MSQQAHVAMEGTFEVVEVVNRMDYQVKVGDKVGTYHINLLKKYEQRDENVVSGMAIIEAELSDECGVVDDENLIELASLKSNETYRDVRIQMWKELI